MNRENRIRNTLFRNRLVVWGIIITITALVFLAGKHFVDEFEFNKIKSEKLEQMKEAALFQKQFAQNVMPLLEGRQEYFSIKFIRLNGNAPSLATFAINERMMRSASLIKLYIIGEAFRQKKNGILDFSEKITMKKSDIVGGAGSLQKKAIGTIFSVNELIEIMITESDNIATNMIIERVGMKNVNKFIADNGFSSSMLQRKMMDVEAIKLGRENYTSVGDVAQFFKKIYFHELVDNESDISILNILLRQTDNDKIPALLPPTIKVAHKTGELIGAVHDAGVIFSEKGDFILCIMTEEAFNVIQISKIISEIAQRVFDQELVGRVSSE